MKKILILIILLIPLTINAQDKTPYVKPTRDDFVEAMILERTYSYEEIQKQTGASIEEIKEIEANIDKKEKATPQEMVFLATTLTGKENNYAKFLAGSSISILEKEKPINAKLLAQAYHTLGSIFLNENSFDEALHYYDISLKYNPNNLSIYKLQGRIYGVQHRFNDAKIAFAKAKEINPDDKKLIAYIKELEDFLKANPNLEDVSESLKNN